MRRLVMMLCLAVVTVTYAADGAWSTYHGDAQLTGYADVELPARPVERWRFRTGAWVVSPPVSDGKQIYVVSEKGQVQALDLAGRKQWEVVLKNVELGAPAAVRDGVLFAGSANGRLYALDTRTGETLWDYKVGETIMGSVNWVTPANGTLVVLVMAQEDGALHGVDPATGKRKWKGEPIDRCDGSPSVRGDEVLFGSCASALHVVSGATGKITTTIEAGDDEDSQIASGTAVVGAWAYAGTRDGRFLCVDLAAGKILWVNKDNKKEAFTTPAVSKTHVVFGSDDGFVYALDPRTGATLWKTDTGGTPSSPVIARDKVVVSADGTLLLLNIETGERLWSKEISDEITSPSLIHGQIVVGTDDGVVVAFGAM